MRKPSRTVFEKENSLFIDTQSLGDLLNVVRSGVAYMEAIRGDADLETPLGRFVADFAGAVMPRLESVEKLRLERAAILDSNHPAFGEACSSVRTVGTGNPSAPVASFQKRSAALLLVPHPPAS